MDVAMRQLSLAMGTNQAYLVGQTNDAGNLGPVLVIGPGDLTNTATLMPLISGDLASLNAYPTNIPAAVTAYLDARTNTASQSGINLNLRNKLVQDTTNSGLYRAPWVYVTDSNGQTNARYAYILLDEWARVNPAHHSGQPRNNPTNWFAGPEVLPLFTGGTNLLSGTEATNSQALVGWLLSPHTPGQAFASPAAYEAKKHLLSVDQTESPDVIPADLPEGGSPKYNINDLATNTIHGATAELRANKIADIINSNLPNFGPRDLGLQVEDPSGGKYLRRLAANIVDYIDTDTVPTDVNGGEPAGKELAPYVTMVAERNTWVSETAGPAPYTVVIRSEFFLQLWNPYTVPVSGAIELEVIGRQYIEMRDGGALTDLLDFSSPAPVAVTSLRPNEHKAYSLGATLQSFINFVNQPSSSIARYPTWPATSSSSGSLTGHPEFRMLWNGTLLDMNRQEPIMQPPANSGLQRFTPGNLFGPIGVMRWAFNFVPSNIPNTVADPRGSWLCQSDWAGAVTIALAKWQGRQTDTAGRSQNLQSAWAARDYVPNNPSFGISLASIGDDPVLLAPQYNAITDPKNAPAILQNQAMGSIGELGNIFDPMQVNNTGGNFSGGSPPSYYRPVGGYSLRVGQPEFSFAASDGRRSIELLDLFTINTTNGTSTNFPVTRGRINVNTAPQPVLEALFYGISPTSDAAFTNSVIGSDEAATLAQLLMTNRPYHKLSDLYKITSGLADATNYTPPLSTNTAGKAAVFDRAREEAFGKMAGLATVQSRAFRVYVVGQSLGPNLRQQAQTALEAALTVKTEPNGQLTPEIQYVRWEN